MLEKSISLKVKLFYGIFCRKKWVWLLSYVTSLGASSAGFWAAAAAAADAAAAVSVEAGEEDPPPTEPVPMPPNN